MKRHVLAAGQASRQATDSVLMIRPARFLSNPQTAGSNAFQHCRLDADAAHAGAIGEFDAYALALRSAGVNVLVVDDCPHPHTPDAIFPNNWLSADHAGRITLFPMHAPNRRQERRFAVLAALETQFAISEVADLGRFAGQERFLEGTGSMVLDHDSRLAYVCRSPRSHPDVMTEFSRLSGYQAIWFSACDAAGRPIYHTNVMMCVGSAFAVVCAEAVPCALERSMLTCALTQAGKQVIDITCGQMQQFAGNMLELRSQAGAPLLAMSRRAWAAFTPPQQAMLARHATPVIAALDTIEEAGGGGARCMLAEIFLPALSVPSSC